jgi:hypothetical protein
MVPGCRASSTVARRVEDRHPAVHMDEEDHDGAAGGVQRSEVNDGGPTDVRMHRQSIGQALMRVGLALTVVAAACERSDRDVQDPTIPPARTSPRATISGQEVEVNACQRVEAADGRLALGGEPPAIPPGARDPTEEDQERNEERPRPLPVDPNGEFLDVSLLSPSVDRPRGAQDPELAEDAVRFGNTITIPWAAYGQLAEPEIAVHGSRMLITWNLGAAFSHDDGSTFQWLNPYLDEVDGGFWGDQRAHYSATHDLWLWVRMYKRSNEDTNTIRLSWFKGDAGLDQRSYGYADWTAEMVGFPGPWWLDQPKLATSNEHVYIAANPYEGGSREGRNSVVVRVRLDQLTEVDTGEPIDATCLTARDPMTGGSLWGAFPTTGAGTTMYLASQMTNAKLAVWRWNDDEAAPTFSVVEDIRENRRSVTYPPDDRPYTCKRHGADVPDSSDWCRSRNDTRITSAWIHDSRIGFAWNVRQYDAVPFPFVWVIELDASRLDDCQTGACVLGYPVIRNPGHAIQYAAISANADGGLGGVVLVGGGDVNYLTCKGVIRDRFATDESGWDRAAPDIGKSEGDLPNPYSGDYLGIWPHGGNANTWAASCMRYDRTSAENERNHVLVARFGRRADTP